MFGQIEKPAHFGETSEREVSGGKDHRTVSYQKRCSDFEKARGVRVLKKKEMGAAVKSSSNRTWRLPLSQG